MVRQLLALAVAVALFSAPLTAGVCQIACAAPETEHQALHASSHHHHSGVSATTTTASGLTLTAASHMCRHWNDAAVGLELVRQAQTPPAIVATAILIAPLVVRSVPTLGAGPNASPPRLLALRSQLRT